MFLLRVFMLERVSSKNHESQLQLFIPIPSEKFSLKEAKGLGSP
jgi:hypothetical protein